MDWFNFYCPVEQKDYDIFITFLYKTERKAKQTWTGSYIEQLMKHIVIFLSYIVKFKIV